MGMLEGWLEQFVLWADVCCEVMILLLLLLPSYFTVEEWEGKDTEVTQIVLKPYI